MPFVGVRELARNVSRFLEEVEKGEEPIVVTRRGQPIAVLQRADRTRMIRGLGGRPKDLGDLPPNIRPALGELRSGLEDLYGDRLKGIYVFGSYARGEADPVDSDLDVAIVLDQIQSYDRELHRSTRLASTLSIRHGITIGRVVIPGSEWTGGESPFLANVRSEAISA